MVDLTWKVFCMTGSIDSYLLMKEMEQDEDVESDDETGSTDKEPVQ
ncbi:YqzL family protein [Sporolactobacillus sp. THM7-4]|nr:YqzL family protein [Sporolactobacillus sp. THM7-4]